MMIVRLAVSVPYRQRPTRIDCEIMKKKPNFPIPIQYGDRALDADTVVRAQLGKGFPALVVRFYDARARGAG
jgi:hypothetical protein